MQNVLAHILVKIEKPLTSVTNTDSTLPLSLRPGRQVRPPSSDRRTSGGTEQSSGRRSLNDFDSPITSHLPLSSPTVEQLEQHALLSKFEQEQRDHELAQKLQEDLRIEDERAREEHNRKIERQQRQWADQVAGNELPNSEIDIARRRQRERERLLLLRERERRQQSEAQFSYPDQRHQLQTKAKTGYPHNVPLTSPPYNARIPPANYRHAPYAHPYANQRTQLMPTSQTHPNQRSRIAKNQKTLQGVRSLGNLYDNYHSDGANRYAIPNMNAQYARHHGPVLIPNQQQFQQPQQISPANSIKPYPSGYTSGNNSIPFPSPSNAYPLPPISHPQVVPSNQSLSNDQQLGPMPTSPYNSVAKARLHSEEELNWIYKKNQVEPLRIQGKYSFFLKSTTFINNSIRKFISTALYTPTKLKSCYITLWIFKFSI